MDTKDKNDLDRILRMLYKDSPQPWFKIYSELDIEKSRADHLFKIGHAFDYLTVEHKGGNEFESDNHYVGITRNGTKFFALSNFSGESQPNSTRTMTSKFNVYINGSSGGMNLLDIDNEQLDIVVDAFLMGTPDFTLAGQYYRPKKFYTFKIFENNSKLNARELKNIGLDEGGHKGFNGKFFTETDLGEFGEDLTYRYVGNSQFGAKSINQPSQNQAKVVNQMGSLKALAVENHHPPIFISYCWDSDDHEDHVFSFAKKLRADGYHVDIDKIRSQKHSATNFIQMMEEAFSQSEKIIVVLSEKYKHKAERFIGGVGHEYRIILNEIDKKPMKYILVSFNGRDDTIIPNGFLGRDIVDLKSGSFNTLFRKLNEEPQYVLPPVSKERPKLVQREIQSFDHYQSKLTKANNADNQEAKITKRLAKKKQLSEDFAPWLNYKKEDVKRRFRMIIHSCENDIYPEQIVESKVNPTWFGAEIYGSNHLGLEFCNENSMVYVDEKGRWTDEQRQGLTARPVSVIKTILYDDILAWDMDGDGIYNCPHFYVLFSNGSPWKELVFIDQEKKYIRYVNDNKLD
jgi:hypothetical protein